MDTPSARLLRLLTVLQSRRHWSGPELSERLAISPRTLRYDVAKLRDLGYVVHAGPGATGGYALQPGGNLPPLTLDDDEAVAIAIGLRIATGVAGLGESAATALLKLEQVMPWRLRGRVNAVRSHTVSVDVAGAATDPDTVVFLAGACRDRRRAHFTYASGEGSTTQRDVEPYRVLQTAGRWYLQAFDPSRSDWRTFRLDRMHVQRPEGTRFVAREPPAPSALEAETDAYYARHRAVVLVEAPIETVSRRLPVRVPIELVDANRCRVHASGESPQALALNLLLIDETFVVEHASPDVLAALTLLRDRITTGLVRSATPP